MMYQFHCPVNVLVLLLPYIKLCQFGVEPQALFLMSWFNSHQKKVHLTEETNLQFPDVHLLYCDRLHSAQQIAVDKLPFFLNFNAALFFLVPNNFF